MDFGQARSRILGALLDAVSVALQNVDGIQLLESPRMADFAKFATAAEPALGLRSGSFLRAYSDNRASAHEVTLEASPIAAFVRLLAEEGFDGTPTELLEALSNLAAESVTKSRDWPRRANVLSGELRRLQPSLEQLGIRVEWHRERSKRRIVIEYAAEPSSSSSPPSLPVLEQRAGDAVDDGDANSLDLSHLNGGSLLPLGSADDDDEYERVRAKFGGAT